MFSRSLSTVLRQPLTKRACAMSTLSQATINQRVVAAAYAVRGELVIKADGMKQHITQAKSTGSPAPYPFEQVVQCNIGNPQELGQAPLTFHRQVLALCSYPALIEQWLKQPNDLFAPDAIARAQRYLSEMPSTGAYTNSMGLSFVRAEVAEFIASRDGFAADPNDIFLTDGASTGVKAILQLLIRDEKDSVMTPIPQYPLYSATLSLLGGSPAGYYLNESTNWSLSTTELERAYNAAREAGQNVRALVVINPGNPTGQCLPRDTMVEVVEFCAKNKLVLMADEVYQENVYSDVPFTSFKSVVRAMNSQIELVSFHSTSKGFLGECGQRGGYMELTNINEDVRSQIYKLASVSLCSNVSGQLMTGLMVNPPAKGDASYELYIKERDTILDSMKRRAIVVADAMNNCEGISCQPVQGSMYAFPRIHLSAKAIEAAKLAGKQPDTFYCLALLEATGLVTVPGSGFGQRENEWHLRSTILPKEAQLNDVMERFASFHKSFMKRYA